MYRKIRGHKRRWNKINKWIVEESVLDVEYLKQNLYWYSDIAIHPWCDISLTRSQFPEPKRQTKKHILQGLENIYDNWKIELEKLNQPYYLKVWIYEPRFSKSQVVCAIDERIEHYKNVFNQSNFKSEKSDLLNILNPGFKWQSFFDEQPYWKSELLWPMNQYERIEDAYADRKLLKKLEKGNYRNEKTDDDIVFFIPKGKIWVGAK